MLAIDINITTPKGLKMEHHRVSNQQINKLTTNQLAKICKTKPIYAVFRLKTTILKKNEPKTKPNEPNFGLITPVHFANKPKLVLRSFSEAGTNPILSRRSTAKTD